MEIKLYRLTQTKELDEFRRFVTDHADSYLQYISFHDMCMFEVDFMRESAMDFSIMELDGLFWEEMEPGEIFVDDFELAHKVILTEFDSALMRMFLLSLVYELEVDLERDGRITFRFFKPKSALNSFLEVVRLNTNECKVAYRVTDSGGGDKWSIGEVGDVYRTWRELKDIEAKLLNEMGGGGAI